MASTKWTVATLGTALEKTQASVQKLQAVTDKMDAGLKDVTKAVTEILDMVETAEFPESNDRHGHSIKQALRDVLERLDGLTEKVERKEGITTEHQLEKIVNHPFFKPAYEKKCAELLGFKEEKRRLTVRLKELSQHLDDNKIEVEVLEEQIARGVEVDEDEQNNKENLAKAKEHRTELEAAKAKCDSQITAVEEKLKKRPDRMQRTCRNNKCGKQCRYYCSLCSKDAENEKGVFYICSGDCMDFHQKNPGHRDFIKSEVLEKSKSKKRKADEEA
jgi:hypothetical protein